MTGGIARRRRRLDRGAWACIVSALALMSGIAHAGTGSAPDYWFRILVPDNLVPAQIGRAVFREGRDEILVLAARLPVRQYALRQLTGLTGASVQHLPDATVLRIPVPSGQVLIASAAPASFHVRLSTNGLAKTIGLSFDRGKIHFRTSMAGPVVAMTDGLTGRPLLVGTVTGPVSISRPMSGPGYRFLPATRGLAAEASTDELALHGEPGGFVLESMLPGGELPVGHPPITPPLTAASYMPDGLDLPRDGRRELRKRLQAARLAVAAAPPLDRRDVTLNLARVMLALGMGNEARGALDDLDAADPSVTHDPQWAVLHEVANIVAWDPAANRGVWPKWQNNPPERRLWRGLADVEAGKWTAAAGRLDKQIPLLAALPPVLRGLFVPRAAEALIAGGKPAAAQALFKFLPQQHSLDLARAELQEAQGHEHAALAAYQALFGSRNNRTAGIARTRAIMLRYKLHQIDAKTAASDLARYIDEWRGARHELAVRLDLARLQATEGAWPDAMTGLNRARELFPGEATKIDVVRHALFDRLTGSGALDNMSPLAVTALIENNTDLVPPGSAGVPILKTLSRQLLALGLTDPAAGILKQLISSTTDPGSRARLGLDLARLELRAGDSKKAGQALDETDEPDLAPALRAARAALSSQVAIEDGKPAAPDAIAQQQDPQDLAHLARLAAQGSDWKTAIHALQRLVALQVPAQGSLDASQTRLVTQLATAASKAKDSNLTATLRQTYLDRLPKGPQEALFDTITATPLGPDSSLAQALHQITAIETLADEKTNAPAPNAGK